MSGGIWYEETTKSDGLFNQIYLALVSSGLGSVYIEGLGLCSATSKAYDVFLQEEGQV